MPETSQHEKPARNVPIDANLFEEDSDGPCLIGGRAKSDGRFVFPLPAGVASAQFDRVRLGSTGRLWSWTIQRFAPKSPPYVETGVPFTPFAVGYIELPDIIVESRLLAGDFSELRIGLEMGLVIVPYSRTPDGEMRTTYAFRRKGERS